MTAALDYDALAEEYARHRRVHPGVLEVLLRHLHRTGSRRVLEVGCGSMDYSAALMEAGDCQCWGLDPSAEMLAGAPGRGSRLRARAEQMPVADESVQLVLSVDVIHHLDDTASHFREAHRVLQPGRWLCTVTDSEDIIRRRRPMSAYFPETVTVELARYPAPARLRREMDQAGFVDQNEVLVEQHLTLTDAAPYRDRAYSALHLIPDAAFARGLARLEDDLRQAPVPATANYIMLWARRHPA